MIISFQSPGLIDPRCITTIGVSVKETKNPIGFFGTGLKYAISIILRSGGSVTIWRGLEPLRFSAKETSIRGAAVQLVCMNGQELGFTTALGKHWKMWQAFREIWCNTQDEDGTCNGEEIAPTFDTTTVHVESEEFAVAWRERDKFILRSRPIHETPEVNFHPGPSQSIFYRGIRVSDEPSKPWTFLPNVIEELRLTEDRTIASPYEARRVIARSILLSEDEGFIERWLTTSQSSAEHELDLNWPSTAPSEAFLAVGRELLADRSRTKNLTLKRILTRYEPEPEIEEAGLLDSETARLRQAVVFCKELKYNVDEFPILIVESLGEGILGKADREKRRILVSRRAIQMGDLTLAGTLIEEWVHIKHELDDCSREMQNWLVDSLCRLGEAYLFVRPK